jgi:amidohydrolase
MGWIPDPREGIQENIRSQSLRLESGVKHTISNNHPFCMARIQTLRDFIMINIKELVNEQKDLIINTRRDLHRIPETAYTEKKTAAYVTDYLNREGFDVQTGIARLGVVGLMKTGKPGPTLMIRADMDALPLSEATGLAFSSTHEGIMHACGHDAHMAMALGAATVLNKIKSELSGNIKFLFQPAEEGPGGAKPMIEAGVMETPG